MRKKNKRLVSQKKEKRKKNLNLNPNQLRMKMKTNNQRKFMFLIKRRIMQEESLLPNMRSLNLLKLFA